MEETFENTKKSTKEKEKQKMLIIPISIAIYSISSFLLALLQLKKNVTYAYIFL